MNPLLEAHRDALSELCRRFRVRRLEIFGSGARDRPIDGDSDLDFLVDFGPHPDSSPADQYFGLLSELEALFERRIDLLTPRSLKNRFFIASVEESKKLLYAA